MTSSGHRFAGLVKVHRLHPGRASGVSGALRQINSRKMYIYYNIKNLAAASVSEQVNRHRAAASALRQGGVALSQ